MASKRILKRNAVFVTDPDTLAVYRFEAGQEVPEKFKVGDHLFEDEPDLAGTPQTGGFGRVLPFGQEPAGDSGGGDGYDPGEYNADEVVEYVGEDQAKAQAVLEQERAGQNRKGLTQQLEKVANPQ